MRTHVTHPDKLGISIDMSQKSKTQNNQMGASLIEVVIVMTLIAVVSAFALIGIVDARDKLRLQNSVAKLASYLEKSRIDAVRRHDSSGTVGVVFNSPTSYNVTMDFDGTGVATTRNIPLESGAKVIDLALPSVTFNWRGRTSSCTITFAIQSSQGWQSWVDVSDAGDITINNNVDVLPSVSYSTVNGTSSVYSGTVVSGAGVRSNTADCGTVGGGAPGPPITGTGTSCTLTGTPSSFSIKKNGGGTGSVAISVSGMSGMNTITTSTVSNLKVTPSSQTISGNSTANFSITSLNATRGTFGVTFSSPCTSVVVAVKVTN